MNPQEMDNNQLVMACMQAWKAQDMSTFSTLCEEATKRNLMEWWEDAE